MRTDPGCPNSFIQNFLHFICIFSRRDAPRPQEEILAVPSSELERLHTLITDIKTRMSDERNRLQGELHLETKRQENTAAKLAAVYRCLRKQLASLGVYASGACLPLLFRIFLT